MWAIYISRCRSQSVVSWSRHRYSCCGCSRKCQLSHVYCVVWIEIVGAVGLFQYKLSFKTKCIKSSNVDALKKKERKKEKWQSENGYLPLTSWPKVHKLWMSSKTIINWSVSRITGLIKEIGSNKIRNIKWPSTNKGKHIDTPIHMMVDGYNSHRFIVW